MFLERFGDRHEPVGSNGGVLASKLHFADAHLLVLFARFKIECVIAAGREPNGIQSHIELLFVKNGTGLAGLLD